MKLTKTKQQFIQQNKSVTLLSNRMLKREGKSENTLRRYLDGVKVFTEYMKAENPDMALQAFAESADRTATLDAFIDYLIGQGVNAVNLKGLFFGVKKWLIANRVNGVDWDYISRPKVASQISDRIPTTEELQLILNNKVSLRDKALFLTAESSGLRLGTLLTLQVGDYEPIEELGKIMVAGGVGRKLPEGKSYFTFVTPETRKILKQYLKTREDVKPADPLFAKENGQPLAPYVQNLSRQWRRLLKRANLKTKINGHKWTELHAHTLRKFFQTHAKLSGCRNAFVDFWLGHHPSKTSEYLNDSYFRPELKAHLAEYRKAVPSLQVFEVNVQQAKEMEKLEKQVKELSEVGLKIVAVNERYREEITAKNQQIEDYQQLIKDMVAVLKKEP